MNGSAGKMRLDWNERAKRDPQWYIASDARDESDFRSSGKRDVDFCLRGLATDWLAEAETLEIGCGIGRMTEFLLPKVRRLVAIDVSTEMIARARERVSESPRLDIIATNGEDLSEFSDNCFDFILSYVVFQHIPKYVARKYLLDARRVLRDNGVMRVQLARISDPAYVPPPDDDTFSMRSWTVEDVRAELKPWREHELELLQVTPTTDHIWVTAKA